MLDAVSLRFGECPEQALQLPRSAVTVFVGPNNSGKSLALRELQELCTSGKPTAYGRIVSDVSFSGLDSESASRLFRELIIRPRPGESVPAGHEVIAVGTGRVHLQREQLVNALTNPNASKPNFCGWYFRHQTMILDGKGRIGLVEPQKVADLLDSPQASFHVLFSDPSKRGEVRRIVKDAFGQYLVVDPTNLGRLRLRLSQREPVCEAEEQSLDERARAFHGAASDISTTSDGVKAFVGIVTAVMAGDPELLLIDEPEAFLHPSLSRLLGFELARAASKSGKRVFAATHSANFLMGCIQSGVDVAIVRLTYREGVPSARVLPNEELVRLMRNPLLRSTGVLEGLFFESVVVTEGDTDRAFYQEINQRLDEEGGDQAIPNCLFLNAQNKQTEHHIVGPLRQLGIPAAAIVDIDIFKDDGKALQNLLRAVGLGEVDRKSLSDDRAALLRRFVAAGKNMKRDGGIGLLQGADREAAETFLARLADYGLFVVPDGEIEVWLPELPASSHGPGWLMQKFEAMGEDPTSPSYLKPSDGDVWDFLRGIGRWVRDPGRRGLSRG